MDALELKWFSHEEEPATLARQVEQNLLSTLATACPLPHLTIIRLKGLRTSTGSLVDLFKNHPRIEHVDLEAIFPSANDRRAELFRSLHRRKE